MKAFSPHTAQCLMPLLRVTENHIPPSTAHIPESEKVQAQAASARQIKRLALHSECSSRPLQN